MSCLLVSDKRFELPCFRLFVSDTEHRFTAEQALTHIVFKQVTGRKVMFFIVTIVERNQIIINCIFHNIFCCKKYNW